MLRRSIRLASAAVEAIEPTSIKSEIKKRVKRSVSAISKAKSPSPVPSITSEQNAIQKVDSQGQISTKDESSPIPKKRRKVAKEKEEFIFPTRLIRNHFVGAHVSAAGGPQFAIINAAKIACNSFAFFTRNQRAWKSAPLSQENISEFKRLLDVHNYSPKHILPHGSYLVNLAQPDEVKWDQAYEAFLDEVTRCQQLGLTLFNFHPGAAVGADITEACARIAKGINKVHTATAGVKICIESMCGSGTQVGGTWEEIASIIDLVDDKTRVGVVIDSCHSFAAGYDIRTSDGWNDMMKDFDNKIGLVYFSGMHLNDSKGLLDSHLDRHEGIGSGAIGLDCFKHIMQDARTQDMPLILETPGNVDELEEPWIHEISLLYALADGDVQKAEEVRQQVAQLRAESDIQSKLKKDLKKSEKLRNKTADT